jgi:lipopolysaccharide/colanic/teichoic acid biosynthesis glycosyltransferase
VGRRGALRDARVVTMGAGAALPAAAGPGAAALKRGMDVAVSAALLVAAAPLLALSALAVLVEDGRPVLFRQARVGWRGRDFALLKLRSMRVHDAAPEAVGQVRGDHALVTRAGRVLRRLKLDELPQLWNVLRGDMSLVGPRPTIRSQVDAYDAFQRRRLLVRPGMTGWAQVNGNTEVSWEERIELDVWYVDHWSPWLDLRILAATAMVVLRGERVGGRAVAVAHEHADRSRRGG